MIETIATIILLVGFIGMSVIIFKKIPVPAGLPAQQVKGGVFGRMREKIKSNGFLKSFSGEILLQKILSKFRVLTLRAESKTGSLLMKLRQKNKNKFSDDYWKKLRRGK